MAEQPGRPLPLPPMSELEVRRYRRFKRIAAIVNFVLAIGFLAVAVATGAETWLRDEIEEFTGIQPAGAAIYFVDLYLALAVITFLPRVYGGLFLERRAGLSVQLFGSWMQDWVKSLAISLALGAAGAAAVYGLLDVFPDVWWLIAGAGFTVFVVLLANLAPVLLMPVFFRFEPLPEGPVRERLMGLCARAGVRAVNASIWKVSDKSKRSNAAVVGWGNTRRVIVADTMLDTYAPGEIEAVLAHELGHHVSGDVRNAILLQTPITFLAFLAVHVLLGLLDGPLDLTGREDLAGMPALALILAGVTLVTLPFVNAYSRHRETAADRFALGMIDDPASLARALDKLAGQNLADRSPHPLVEFLFHSHPSIGKRIATANARSEGTRAAGTAGA